VNIGDIFLALAALLWGGAAGAFGFALGVRRAARLAEDAVNEWHEQREHAIQARHSAGHPRITRMKFRR